MIDLIILFIKSIDSRLIIILINFVHYDLYFFNIYLFNIIIL